MQPICSSTLEIPPICSPAICPLVAPSIAPIAPLQLPPIGTQACRQVQVLDPYTGRYRWQTVCQ